MDFSSLGATFIMLMLVMGVFILAALAFWIWMLVDAAMRTNFPTQGEKIAWIVVIALTGTLGALIYFFAAYLRLRDHGVPPATPSSPAPTHPTK